MRKLLLLLVFAVACSLAGFSQDTATQGNTTDQSTTTTTKTTKTRHKKAEANETGAASTSAKHAQLTGCLAKDASGSGFMLTNGRYKKGVAVKSDQDLSAHVGHKVKLMGSWEKPTAAAGGGAGPKGETMRTFNASSMEHVSDTCTAAAGKKKGAEKTPPGF